MKMCALLIIGTALLCGACSKSVSPTAPSSVAAMPEPAAAAGALGAPVLSQTAVSVPFKGRLEGTQTVTPLAPPLALVEGVATGNATHLGRFTVEFPHTVNFATASGVGTYTFTTVSGDTLTATFTGQAQVGAVTSIVENATITGGTGRFAGATGSFTVQRVFDPANGTTTGSFEGTMSSVGAGNP